MKQRKGTLLFCINRTPLHASFNFKIHKNCFLNQSSMRFLTSNRVFVKLNKKKQMKQLRNKKFKISNIDLTPLKNRVVKLLIVNTLLQCIMLKVFAEIVTIVKVVISSQLNVSTLTGNFMQEVCVKHVT